MVLEGRGPMKYRILVVDDNPDILDIFQTQLTREGHEVVTLDSQTSAMEIISETPLDFIIADIRLENGSGLDILNAVTDRKRICPVIMVTGNPNFETAA